MNISRIKLIQNGLIILGIIFVSGLAFAGGMATLECDTCGYKSETLLEGIAGEGYANSIIYCETCKNFYAIPTEIVLETARHKKSDIPKPAKKEVFLGQERAVYSCSKCGGKAFAYDGPVCPICKKGKLHKKYIGHWD